MMVTLSASRGCDWVFVTQPSLAYKCGNTTKHLNIENIFTNIQYKLMFIWWGCCFLFCVSRLPPLYLIIQKDSDLVTQAQRAQNTIQQIFPSCRGDNCRVWDHWDGFYTLRSADTCQHPGWCAGQSARTRTSRVGSQTHDNQQGVGRR